MHVGTMAVVVRQTVLLCDGGTFSIDIVVEGGVVELGAQLVEEVAALHLKLVVEVGIAVIHTDSIGARHAILRTHAVAHTTSETATHTAALLQVIEGEVLLVDIVAHAQQGDAAIALEEVEVEARVPITLVEVKVGTKSAINTSEYTVTTI